MTDPTVSEAMIEIAALRETNKRLNRRATSAEGALTVRIEEMQRAGQSLGRSFANAGYQMAEFRRQECEVENRRLRAEVEALRAAPPAVHPDTVRIDYLERTGFGVCEPSLVDEEEDRHEWRVHCASAGPVAYGLTLRDALDVARAATPEGT